MFGQTEPSSALSIKSIMYAVYGWMTVALAVTAGTAYYIAQTPTFYQMLVDNSWLLFALFIGQISLVLILTIFLHRMSLTGALAMFLVYAALLGVTLSSIFLVFTQASIVTTFLVTAGTFGVTGLYGYFTKSDLSAIGSLSMMALFGLIIGLVVNLFLQNQMIDFILSGVGVIVFTLLTAYDTQKIKQIAQKMSANKEVSGKIAILGALTLYLDFINLFLYLLRFFGKQKE